MNNTIKNNSQDYSQKVKWNVLAHINCIIEAINDSELEPSKTALYQTTLLRLSEYFRTNETETWILCFAIWQHFEDNSYITANDFAIFLSTNVLRVAAMNKDFLNLRRRNLIEYSETKSTFEAKDEVIKAVLNNKIIPSTLKIEIFYQDFLRQFAKKYENRQYSNDSYDDYFAKLCEMEERHSYIPLVVRCKEFFFVDETRFMFYDLCNDCLLGCPTVLTSLIENVYEDNEGFIAAREFLDEKHFLQKKGFVKFKDKGSLVDATLVLTEKAKKFFLDGDYDLYAKKDIDKRLKKTEDIPAKKLFYNEENEKQIDEVTKALSQSKYKAIQKRLSEKALPKGIAIILHGAPGCGKTETVYQLAKKTGRAIMQVDISNTKSCWFGESEKMIKQVFSDYKEVCKKSEKEKNGHTPILFINECDAIFSKRKDISASNSQQVENTIQNIILEEMEKLEGILIATTNLIDNLDPAFERRFLFKIRFENPSLEAKEAIWKNRFEWITQGQAQDLARNYNFSGGEIENIARKAEMREIVSGSRPLFSDIEDMCRVEKITSTTTHKPLGFAI